MSGIGSGAVAPAGGAGVAAGSRVLALVGSGGDGVALLADLLLRMAAQQGLYGVMVQSYGPQIRGGESAAILRLSARPTAYEGGDADLLLCFRSHDLARFRGSVRLHAGSLVIQERSDDGALPEWAGRPVAPPLRYPFATLADGVEVPGPPKNMLALGLLCRALGWAPALARDALAERFSHRPMVLAANLAAFERGAAAEGVPALGAPAGRGRGLWVESGNEACARGAMDAGIRFFAGYPITPSSEIMETLLAELPARGGRVIQAEDEMAALGMVVGASFGGVPAMTATSGPGLSLMTEMVGLAAMAEIPVVIVDAQRAGPATGMPSRTEQSDLFHAVFGGHGDLPRVVLGVFDVVHAREVMHRAVGIAERHQLPVLVLSDAAIAQRRQIRDPLAEPPPPPRRRAWAEGDAPLRFVLSDEPRATPFRVPGTPGGTYLAAGIEHTPEGYPTADGGMHERMNARRFAKLEQVAAEGRDAFRAFGDPTAPRGLVGWGSMQAVLAEWVAHHPGYRAFLPEMLHPFPVEAFARWRRGLEAGAVVELSHQGQLHRIMSGLCDLSGFRSIARSGGLPLSLRELAERLEEPSC